MLGINQLTGFGAGGDRGAMSVNYLMGASDTVGATLLVELTPLSITAARVLVNAAAGDNAGGSGESSFEGFSTSGTTRINTTQDPGADNSGVSLAVQTHTIPTTTASGAVNALWLDTFTTAAKTALSYEVWSATGTPVFVSASSNASNGSTPSVSATLEPGDLMIGFVAQEASTAPTATAGTGWSAQNGTIADTTVAGTSIALHSQTLIATAGGTHTYEPTLSAARDYVVGCVVLRAPF